MKNIVPNPSTFDIIIATLTTLCTFLCTYFLHLTMANSEQYLAIVSVMFMDGFFGVIAGTKREGFKTCKAISVLKNTIVWIGILTVILTVEKGFSGTAWLSEVIVVPFMVFQLISALKNASMAGFIKSNQLNKILDLIDNHKGIRDDEPKPTTKLPKTTKPKK
jgi:phage-related holin